MWQQVPVASVSAWWKRGRAGTTMERVLPAVQATEDRRASRRVGAHHNAGKIVEKLTDRKVVDGRIEYQAILQPGASGGVDGGGGGSSGCRGGGETRSRRQQQSSLSGWFSVHALRRLKTHEGQTIEGMMQELDAKLGSILEESP